MYNDTCKCRLYMCICFHSVPILTRIHSPIRLQYNPIQTNTSPNIQTNTSTNTDEYTQHRFSILAPANTALGTVKSGSPASTARAASTASILLYRCLRGFCSSQAVHFSGRRINHILLFFLRLQYIQILTR